MSNNNADFFDSKEHHPWSRMKDQVLGSYVTAYLGKIASWSDSILIIDTFAGPGKTDDGEAGSPLIICKAAKRLAYGKHIAIFINNDFHYHTQLTALLQAGGFEDSTLTIHGDGPSFLSHIAPMLTDQSVFLYIDPFGLECEFDVLIPFLERNVNLSTDILINLQIPVIHRLAARDANQAGTIDSELNKERHEKLTRTLGGDYWKEILFSDLHTKTREHLLIEGYKARIASTGYLTFTGSCPIQENRTGSTKYFMISASRHPDALIICNDAMCKAFNEYIHEQETRDTLFAGQSWDSWRTSKQLENLVIEYVNKYPGQTRKELWVNIIKDHFMRFTQSEYRKAVSQLIKTVRIACSTPYPSVTRPSSKLNDNCELIPVSEIATEN